MLKKIELASIAAISMGHQYAWIEFTRIANEIYNGINLNSMKNLVALLNKLTSSYILHFYIEHVHFNSKINKNFTH